MLENIRQIQNPILRSAAAASVAFSIVTIVSGVVLGLVNPKEKSAAQAGVYSSLLGTGFGAIFGLVLTNKTSQKTSESQEIISKTWKDWRNFVVVRKVKESEEITSFYLQPEDKESIPNFQPGQFLTIKLDIPGQNKPVIRTYSLSDYSENCTYYRLSIKRELAPKGLDVAPGIASNFMHDRIHEGAIIQAKPPNGKFVLDVQKSTPAVLISNGVGITPMISMAKAATYFNSDRSIWFVHGARDGRFHAFRDEVRELAQQHPQLNVHFRYSRPIPEDEGHYHSVGYVDATLIQQLAGKEAEYFLCGSPAFMESILQGLKESGIPDSKVFFESFGQPMKVVSQNQPPVNPISEGVQTAEIVFQKSGQTLTWNQGDGSILEFAEANDINPPFSCRVGVCGTCRCKISAGEVAYQEEPTAATDESSVLICISQPGSSRVVLDI